MSISPSSSVRQAREALAQRLREIRIVAGLTERAIARAAGWHESKCSRIEHARTPPSADDVRAWCTACGADSEIPDLLASLRAADAAYMEWRRMQVTGLRHLQKILVPVYDRTRVFRSYQSHVLPGFLQTREYAEALLGIIAAVHGAPDDSPEAAEARVVRSRVLRDPGKQFTFVVEEPVLRYRIGSDNVMAAQLHHLISVAALPTVQFGVIPALSRRRVWPLEGFIIFDDETVQVELLSARVEVTRPQEIGLYLRAMKSMEQMAVYGREARELIGAALVWFE
jgi:transcriptional regulator with XRE-family HTH domain